MTIDHRPLTIHEAGAAMRAGTLTPIDLLEQCLKCIDQFESLIRAWVVVDRDGARGQAERLTDELKRGQVRGPLHGIPIGIKDIIDVFDLPTGCGSKLWAHSIARQDATCVKRLREAGAVILGKTVTTAYAYLDPPITRNPWAPARTPGGSSSGSAAAVACGMCLAALGSQTGGSLTRPASFCGVASCKPSWGRVSVEGVLPLAHRLDHVGVIGRCVKDLDLTLQPLIRAPETINGPLAQRPLRFARLRGRFEEAADAEMWNLIANFSEILGPAASIGIADVHLSPAFDDVWRHHRVIMAAGAAEFHGKRFRRRPDDYPPKIAALIEEGLGLSANDVVAATIHRDNLIREMALMFDTFDALLTPAARGPAPSRDTTGDAVFNAPWSYLQLPTVSFPIGVSSENKMPLAVQLVGKWNGEGELLAVAEACEQSIGCEIGFPPAPE
jgi:Asp-tRNA(Asn)/Glu-tRNA(Gln) amidotransferase A subunit family amidase